jgi:hypothetical protein
MIINFEIEDQKYKIEDITIRNYYDVKTDLVLNELDAKYKIISILSGCPIEILKDLTLNSWNEIWTALEVMIDTSLKHDIRVVHQFKHNDVEYGLVTFDDLTIGEFADLDLIISSENADNRIHELLAILYRPIIGRKWKKNLIEKYDVEGFKHRSEEFLDLPVSYAKSVSSFFLSIGQASLKATKVFSIQNPTEQEKMIQKISKELLKPGIKLSSSSLEIIRSTSTKLLNSLSTKDLTSSPTKNRNGLSPKKKIKEWLNNIIK